MHLQIVFATDNTYVPHLSAALVSLFESNKIFLEITVHLLANNLTKTEKEKVQAMVATFERKIVIYDLSSTLLALQNKYSIPATISIASYGRLFISQFIGEEVEKIIYADSDALFLGSLSDLWNTPFGDLMVLGVKDHVGLEARIAAGLTTEDTYINAGFLFINLKKWREIDAESIMIRFIADRNGNVNHHDQGVINGCFHVLIGILHPQYNVMTSFFDFKTVENIQKFYLTSNFYSQAEINEAIRDPVFLHFTPSFSKRPWMERSRHPLKRKYWEYLAKTPWHTMKVQKDERKLHHQILEKIYWILGPVLWKKIFV